MTHLKTREPATDLPSEITSEVNPAITPETASPTIEASANEACASKVLVTEPPKQRDRPKSKRRLVRAIAHHPHVVQALIFLSLIGTTSLVLLYLLFRGAWAEQQNNFFILSSIVKMELNRDDTRALSEDSQRVVTRNFTTLEPYVEADGWTWVNRFGSTITYGKQDQRLIASCSPYSPLYIICDLSEIP